MSVGAAGPVSPGFADQQVIATVAVDVADSAGIAHAAQRACAVALACGVRVVGKPEALATVETAGIESAGVIETQRRHAQRERVAERVPFWILGGHAQRIAACIRAARNAAESSRGGIEAEPVRQWRAIIEACAVAEHSAVGVKESTCRQLEAEREAGGCALVGQRVQQAGGVSGGGGDVHPVQNRAITEKHRTQQIRPPVGNGELDAAGCPVPGTLTVHQGRECGVAECGVDQKWPITAICAQQVRTLRRIEQQRLGNFEGIQEVTVLHRARRKQYQGAAEDLIDTAIAPGLQGQTVVRVKLQAQTLRVLYARHAAEVVNALDNDDVVAT